MMIELESTTIKVNLVSPGFTKSRTPLGVTLTSSVDALRLWAETHLDDVLAAQEDYDRSASAR